MPDYEALHRAAAQKAADLHHHLGWEQGVGASVWARTVADELERHETARQRFAADTAGRESWERIALAAVAEHVRDKHLAKTEREANEALRREATHLALKVLRALMLREPWSDHSRFRRAAVAGVGGARAFWKDRDAAHA